jgi:hypothetical protein
MGRKLGISTSEKRFRAIFALALSSAIGDQRGAQSRAAEKLGISRQAMSLYLGRKATPNSALLSRVFANWPELSLKVEGIELKSSDYRPTGPQLSLPLQLTLFDAISEVDNQQLEVEVLRKGVQSIDLKVSIDFGNARLKAEA